MLIGSSSLRTADKKTKQLTLTIGDPNSRIFHRLKLSEFLKRFYTEEDSDEQRDASLAASQFPLLLYLSK